MLTSAATGWCVSCRVGFFTLPLEFCAFSRRTQAGSELIPWRTALPAAEKPFESDRALDYSVAGSGGRATRGVSPTPHPPWVAAARTVSSKRPCETAT